MQINVGKILTGLLTFFVGVVELILGLRFILKLLAASSTATFTLTLYDASDALVAAFEGVFPSFEAANFTLEISTILAMIVYGIVGFIFIYLARNFEGLTVTPGAKSGAPAITQAPQQQSYQPPVQQAPPMQAPYQPPVQPMAPMHPVQAPPMQTPYQPVNQGMPQAPVAPTQPNTMNSPMDPSAMNLSDSNPMNLSDSNPMNLSDSNPMNANPPYPTESNPMNLSDSNPINSGNQSAATPSMQTGNDYQSPNQMPPSQLPSDQDTSNS